MHDTNNFYYKQIQSNNKVNLFTVFVGIKEITDSILRRYKCKDFIKDPSVNNIDTIAKNEEIKEIYLVPPEDVDYERSCLKDGIIYLNRENIEEWLFSIAHEIAHFLNSGKKPLPIPVYRLSRGEANPKEMLEKTVSTLTMLSIIISSCSKGIAETVSEKIGKPVTDKNIIIILKKMASEYYSKNVSKIFAEPRAKFSTVKRIEKIPYLFFGEVREKIPAIVEKVYDEEIADYFAANLLVPTERFLLWEDKSDEEIAQAFHVTLGCIQKRREEIENELYFMSFPKEHALSGKLKIARGNVVGIGKVKIPSMPMFNYNINWLSFLDIQESEDSFVSTCINLRIDGYGETIEEAENDMFENMVYFLCQNFRKLSSSDAWENLQDLYKPDELSIELWDVYHKAQVQLINKIELKNSEYHVNEEKTDVTDNLAIETDGGLANIIRKIMDGLTLQKTYFKVTI